MFHFPTFPPHTLYIQMRVTPHNRCWVSPFGHPRITVRLSTPRGLSQIPTSFIGSWCQGIHHAPLKTWPQRCSRPLYNSQTTHEHQPPTHPVRQPAGPVHEKTPTPQGTPPRTDGLPQGGSCSLRTQQRVDTPTHSTTRSPALHTTTPTQPRRLSRKRGRTSRP